MVQIADRYQRFAAARLSCQGLAALGQSPGQSSEQRSLRDSQQQGFRIWASEVNFVAHQDWGFIWESHLLLRKRLPLGLCRKTPRSPASLLGTPVNSEYTGTVHRKQRLLFNQQSLPVLLTITSTAMGDTISTSTGRSASTTSPGSALAHCKGSSWLPLKGSRF